jgi:glycosyltransferase involved in cell wall biosynthesis
VVALPSRSEGVPNVLLEAAACGTPLVATRVGGVPEFAHLGRCTLVPPDNPDKLARALGAALADPGPRTPPAPESCRNIAAVVAEMLHLFEQVARKSGAWRVVSGAKEEPLSLATRHAPLTTLT